MTDVAIIGAGPAGISTAIQLKRFDFEPLVFEKQRVGGLLWNAGMVENYPGFAEGISGPELVSHFETHLEKYAIDTIPYGVRQVYYDRTQEEFILETNQTEYRSKILVAATGTKPRTGNYLDRIPKEHHQQVFFDICSLSNEEGKKITIIGAGDIAFDYALTLSKKNQITIYHRTEKISALPLLQRRVANTPNIQLHLNATLTHAEGNKKFLRSFFQKATRRRQPGVETIKNDAHHLVIAIGREPQLDWIGPQLKPQQEQLQRDGLLYKIGDMANGIYRQVAIAAGNGIETAMRIHRKLEKERSKGK